MTAPTDGTPAQGSNGSNGTTVHDRIETQAAIVSMLRTLGIDPSSLLSDSGEDTGQYFKLDPDAVRDDMKLLQKVIDKANDLFIRYESIQTHVHAPAGDDSSVKQAHATQDTIGAAQKQLSNIVKYSTGYYNKLARSVGDYEEIEKANVSDISRAGERASGTAV